MTVPNTNTRNGPYYPNGVTSAFPFTFRALAKDDVQVIRIAADGTAVVLSNALFDVTLTDNGGSAVFASAPLAGDPLYVQLDPAFSQDISFENEGAFLPEVITEALDRSAQRSLWLRDLLSRALVLPVGEAGATLVRAALRTGGKVLGFNASTGALEVQSGSSFKGDPGGNVMAIGLFTAAGGLAIPSGTNIVRTSGCVSVGIGDATFACDPLVTPAFCALYPWAAFIDANGVGFRNIETTLHPFMFGALPTTGTPNLPSNITVGREQFTDCAPGINAMMAYGKSRPERPAFDFRSRGMGIASMITLTYDTLGFFNSRPYIVYPGRLVAMAPMEGMVFIRGNNCQEFGQWDLTGCLDWRSGNPLTDGAYYTGRLAKNGIILQATGGCVLGGANVRGVRRYAVQFFKSFSGDNNSIGTTVGPIVAVCCGSSPTSSDFEITGTYTSPSGRNGGSNNDFAQTQDILFVSQGAGFDPADWEVGDGILVTAPDGTVQSVRCQAFPSGPGNGTSRLVSVYPWVKGLTGTFRAGHGGAVSAPHFNMANTRFESIISLYIGTSLEMRAQYAPAIGTLLSEGAAFSLSFGQQLSGPEGMNIEHYHFENVLRSFVDWASFGGKNCRLGAASNLAFNAQSQFFNQCEVAGPAVVTGPDVNTGTYYQFPRSTALAVEMNGTTLQGQYTGGAPTLRGQSIAYTISNTPKYQCGSIQEYGGITTELYVLIDKSAQRIFGDATSNDIPFYIYGTHATGRLSANVKFIIETGGGTGTGITLNGGTADVTIDRTLYVDAPLRGRIVLVPDDSGASAVNARILIDTPLKPAEVTP